MAGIADSTGACSGRDLCKNPRYNRWLFEQSRHGLALCREDGAFVDVNPSFASIIGYSVEEILALDYGDIAPGKHTSNERNQTDVWPGNAPSDPHEREFTHKNGHPVQVCIASAIVQFDDDQFIYLSAEDIGKCDKQTQRESHLRQLTSHLQTIKEREQAAIAREIHNDLGNHLNGIKIDIFHLSRCLAENHPELAERSDSAMELVNQALESVSHMIRKLRPGVLDFGLAAAISWQAKEFRKRTGISCTLKCNDEDLSIDPDLSTALFRIFQEILSNISRHAKASKVTVNLSDAGGVLTLETHDNGCGITRAEMNKPGTFGIRSMRERARAFGGSLTISGSPGEGTVVSLEIPLSCAGVTTKRTPPEGAGG